MDIKKAKWSTQAALFLDPACNENYDINSLAFDVKSDECSLFNIYDDGVHIASMVLRIDVAADSKELVVVALGGKAKNGALIQELSNFWNALAIKNSADRIRAHVSRKGMMKLMERVGGTLSECVYKKEVHYGR